MFKLPPIKDMKIVKPRENTGSLDSQNAYLRMAYMFIHLPDGVLQVFRKKGKWAVDLAGGSAKQRALLDCLSRLVHSNPLGSRLDIRLVPEAVDLVRANTAIEHFMTCPDHSPCLEAVAMGLLSGHSDSACVPESLSGRDMEILEIIDAKLRENIDASIIFQECIHLKVGQARRPHPRPPLHW